MNVESPWFLLFLFLIAVPIVIHLLNFQRPKKLLFTRLDFIEKIEQKSKNVRNIKKWLILLSRVGLVVSLVLAFALPFCLSDKEETSTEEVYLLFDANTRMGQTLQKVTVVEHAKSFLHKYLDKNPLLTYKFATALESVRYESSAEYINDKIEGVNLSRGTLNNPNEKIKHLSNTGELKNPSVFVVSDFHKRVDLSVLDTNQHVTLVEITKPYDRNVYVDSVYFELIGDKRYLISEVKSSGVMSAETQVQFVVNNVLQGSERCEIQKNGKVKLKFLYEEQSDKDQNAKIVIKDTDAAFDNTFYFILPAKKVYSVGVIARKQVLTKFDKMFGLEKEFSVSLWEYSTVDYQRLETCKTLVFELSDNMVYNNAMLDKINSLSLSVILIPNEKLSISDYQQVLIRLNIVQKVKSFSINESLELDPAQKGAFFSPIFKEFDERVNMPRVIPYVSLGMTSNNVLSLNKKGLLTKFEKGFVLGFDLKRNINFFNHALSLPVFYEMLNVMNQNQNDAKYTRSVTQYVENIDPTLNIQTIEINGINRVFSKVQDKVIIDDVGDLGIGIYEVMVNDSSYDKVAVNLPQSESIVDFYDNEELSTLAKSNENWEYVSLDNQQDVENFIQSGGDESYPLWKYCVILALMFLLIEVVLIRIS